MDGLAEWQLTTGGGVQVYRNEAVAGSSSVVIGLDDIDASIADLSGRGIGAESFTVPSGNFRLSTLQDPAGNTITLSQDLKGEKA